MVKIVLLHARLWVAVCAARRCKMFAAAGISLFVFYTCDGAEEEKPRKMFGY